ncbi:MULTISPECIES: outer membrane protein assembly factor BamE [Halomonadaceae]|uniref:outer membrane protein assembly factor BamE n=1 Tax=Halomonas TaxID=2745 RepID=UPI0018A6E4AC|nr:outer membrane protein assembly factor BamE [Halomonas sp. 328]MBF8223735.1 outer membrane protein assembly factor BamE [Halomonas sp. 328]
MQKLIKTVTLSVALTLVSGCSYFGVYKRDLPQGNLVEQSAVEQLQPGMSRNQVRQLMGSPLLEAPFDSNQWDYVYRLDKAYGGIEQRRVTLTFAGDRLVDVATQGDLSGELPLPSAEGAGPASEGGEPGQAVMPIQ